MLLGIGAARVTARIRPNRHKEASIRIFAVLTLRLRLGAIITTNTHKTEITWMKLVLALVQ